MTETLTSLATDRRLATIETITEISPIPDADAIVRARVRGWDVVVKKGDFAVGDLVVYIEVDSFLPVSDPRFEFLIPRGTRTNEQGIEGHPVKTARLRGQYSQGIAFPVTEFPEAAGATVGDDLTAALAITKWDPPLPGELGESVVGHFPASIRTTGELRVQNFAEVLGTGGDGNWVATEKIDGTSMTVWTDDDGVHVAGRNYEFEYNAHQMFWAKAVELDLHAKLAAEWPGQRAVVQGELYGAGVLSKNSLDIKDKRFAAFTVYVDGTELPRPLWPKFVLDLAVPVYDLPYPATVDEALEQVAGIKSLINPKRNAEGVVWRNTETTTVMIGDRPVRASWKCISNRYAMKNDA